jgi:hypothetical protein
MGIRLRPTGRPVGMSLNPNAARATILSQPALRSEVESKIGRGIMLVLSAIFSILGLVCDAIAGLVLLPKIFITDQELNLVAELPIEPSTSHMTGEVSRATLPVAVTDVTKIDEYRKKYIEARKEERKNGKIGLGFLVAGSFLQVLGVILALL